jgi:tripartite-type tricarboxylate transporter receptor subunit TctC
VQAGKLKPLAVTSARRSPILPAVPTMAEAGVAGYEVYEWNVLFAPAGTSEAIIGKLAAALQKTLDAADVKARIAQLGGEIQTARPDAAQQFVRQQTTLWARLVRERGISVD